MWGWLLVSLYTLLRCVQNNSINLSVLHTKRMKSFINCKESNQICVLCRMSLMTGCLRSYPHSVNHNLRRRRIAFRLNLLLRSSDKSLYILGTIHRAQTGYDKVLWSSDDGDEDDDERRTQSGVGGCDFWLECRDYANAFAMAEQPQTQQRHQFQSSQWVVDW